MITSLSDRDNIDICSITDRENSLREQLFATCPTRGDFLDLLLNLADEFLVTPEERVQFYETSLLCLPIYSLDAEQLKHSNSELA